MLRSLSGRKTIILLSLTVLTLLIAFATYLIISYLNPSTPTMHTSSHPRQSKATSIGPPVRILIPKIKVDSVLEYVGSNADGVMDQPTEPSNAAWLNRRPLPGEVGTSVIAGHFGYKNNKPAVFDDLHQLTTGDKLYVKDSKGSEVAFSVKELKTYSPNQVAAEVFNSNDGKSHLNLITCQGNWNESLKSYDQRLVVFTIRE